ncbi:MAG: hypothetical protein K6F77_09600, partial [Lachnospiraceae bacterium]|nr:hypothetical protein [Lachnospiraceae bacterium]
MNSLETTKLIKDIPLSDNMMKILKDRVYISNIKENGLKKVKDIISQLENEIKELNKINKDYHIITSKDGWAYNRVVNTIYSYDVTQKTYLPNDIDKINDIYTLSFKIFIILSLSGISLISFVVSRLFITLIP